MVDLAYIVFFMSDFFFQDRKMNVVCVYALIHAFLTTSTNYKTGIHTSAVS